MAKMTLAEYAADRDDVVVFYAGVGAPAGAYTTPDGIDEDLVGEVDAAGDWRWDGRGNPRDERANTIYKVHAYVDQAKAAELANW